MEGYAQLKNALAGYAQRERKLRANDRHGRWVRIAGGRGVTWGATRDEEVDVESRAALDAGDGQVSRSAGKAGGTLERRGPW